MVVLRVEGPECTAGAAAVAALFAPAVYTLRCYTWAGVAMPGEPVVQGQCAPSEYWVGWVLGPV